MTTFPPSVRLRSLAIVGLLAAAVVAAPVSAGAAIVFTFPNPFSIDPDSTVAGTIPLTPDGSTTVTVSGEAATGSSVRVTVNDTSRNVSTPACTAVAVDAQWSCTFAPDPFVGEIEAALLDGLGDVQTTIAHPAIAVGTPVLASDSVNIVTSTGIGTISATMEPLGTGVTAMGYLYINGDEVCGGEVEVNGDWSCGYAVDGSPDGEYEIEVTQERDALGVTAISLPALGFLTLDTVGPTVQGTFTTPATNSLRVTQPTYPLAGTAEPFAAVRVVAGAETACGPVTADAAGLWSCTASAPLVDGTYTLRIEQRDVAGNLGTGGSETIALEMRRGVVVIPPPPINIVPPTPIIITGNLTLENVVISSNRVIEATPLVFNALPFVSFTQGGSFSLSYSASQVGTIYNTLVPSTAQLVDTTTLWTIKIRSEELVLDTVRVPFGDPVELSAELPADFPVGDHTFVVEVALEGYEPVEFTTPVEVIAEEEPEEAAPIEEEAAEAPTPISATDGGVAWWLWAAVGLVGVGIIAAIVVMVRNARRQA